MVGIWRVISLSTLIEKLGSILLVIIMYILIIWSLFVFSVPLCFKR